MHEGANLVVRERVADDAPALVEVLREVQVRDRYPYYPAAVHVGWLYDGLDIAWVAELDGSVVGHAAVSPAHELTRFFVAVDARGSGAGSALLDEVEAWADERGLGLGLDVVGHNTDAQKMYERRGWIHVRTGEAPWVEDEPRPALFAFRRPARSAP